MRRAVGPASGKDVRRHGVVVPGAQPIAGGPGGQPESVARVALALRRPGRTLRRTAQGGALDAARPAHLSRPLHTGRRSSLEKVHLSLSAPKSVAFSHLLSKTYSSLGLCLQLRLKFWFSYWLNHGPGPGSNQGPDPGSNPGPDPGSNPGPDSGFRSRLG